MGRVVIETCCSQCSAVTALGEAGRGSRRCLGHSWYHHRGAVEGSPSAAAHGGHRGDIGVSDIGVGDRGVVT